MESYSSPKIMKEKEQRRMNFQELANIAPANNGNQTHRTNRYTKKQLQLITNGATPFSALGFQRSLNSSTLATVLFTRPYGE